MCDAWLGAFSSWPRRGSSAHRICVTGQVRAAEPHPPEGGRHHTTSAPLFYNPRPPQVAGSRGRTPIGWGAHGVTGLTRRETAKSKANKNSKQEQRARGRDCKGAKQKGGKVAIRDCSPIQKVRSVIIDP